LLGKYPSNSLTQKEKENLTETPELIQRANTIFTSLLREQDEKIKELEAIETTYSRMSPQMNTKELETIETTYSQTYLRELNKSIEELTDRIITYLTTLLTVFNVNAFDAYTVYTGNRLKYLHGKKQIEDNGLSVTNQKILYKPDNNNNQLRFEFMNNNFNLTPKGITITTSNKNKNETKQIEFSAILKDPRFLIYALSKLKKDKNAETDVRIDIDVREYQKMRMISRKEAKKQIEEQVLMLSNAWATVKVDTPEGNKTNKRIKRSVDIHLIIMKETSFNNGKLSLWFTPNVVKYLPEYPHARTSVLLHYKPHY
jgi:hypothetical protein